MELRNDLKGYLDGVIKDREPLTVRSSGNNDVVIISLDEYNAIKETEYLMSSQETVAAIRRGEEELKKGDVYSQNQGESIRAFLERVTCTESY
jgi:antitoxin YefM